MTKRLNDVSSRAAQTNIASRIEGMEYSCTERERGSGGGGWVEVFSLVSCPL